MPMTTCKNLFVSMQAAQHSGPCLQSVFFASAAEQRFYKRFRDDSYQNNRSSLFQAGEEAPGSAVSSLSPC